MPSKRTLLIPMAMLAIMFAGSVAMAPRAVAKADDPPFLVRFPQELEATHFANSFGARRSGGRRHKGNDLMAPKMTEVYAIADGVVERIAKSRNAGRYLTIEHEDGWTSSYMHLNNDAPGTDNGRASSDLTYAPGVEEGAHVHAGQLIGWVGDSGNAEWTGSHTHFELRHEGKAVNPYEILQEAWQRDQARQIRDIWGLGNKLDLDFMV